MTKTRTSTDRHAVDGLLIVDKPAGWTSHDVVARVRRLARTRRVGHAGTLDPMATGVLVVGVGRATRLLTYLVGCDKDYRATIRLGQSTLTDDAQGEVTATADASGLTGPEITERIEALTGHILQVPSAVSAIKVNGRRSYARVRAGEQVELPARPVTVSRFALRGRRDRDTVVDLDVEVTVSAGTYVRALARDLGAGLGVGGHLTSLRRTRVGGYTLGQAARLDELADDAPEQLPVLTMADAARAVMPVREISESEAEALRFGRTIDSRRQREEPVAAIHQGVLVAVLTEGADSARSRVVFPPAAQA